MRSHEAQQVQGGSQGKILLTFLGLRLYLQVEAPNLEDGGVLKLEAAVLRELKSRKNVVRLIDSGKREHYT